MEFKVTIWATWDRPLTEDERADLEASIRKGSMGWPQDWRPDAIVDAQVVAHTQDGAS